MRAPLVPYDDDDVVLQTLTPNPLHMKLRSVNKLAHELEKAQLHIATEFFNRIGVTKGRYHGEFEGTPCSLICRRHEVLRNVITAARRIFVTKDGKHKRRRVSRRNQHEVNDAALNDADAFQALDGVMKFSYGAQLVRKHQHCVEDFKVAVSRIGCSVTVSMHMLIHQTPHCCEKHRYRSSGYSGAAAER